VGVAREDSRGSPGPEPIPWDGVAPFTNVMTPDDDLVAHFDRLLAGEAAGADRELGALAGVITQLQGMASAVPDGGDAWIARQAAVAAASVREAKVVSLPTSGNRQRKLRAGVAAAAAAVLLTGGLAAADTLPDPIQHIVSRIVGVVGIHVPDPDGPGNDGTPDPSTPDAVPDETPVEPIGPGTDDDHAKDGTPAAAEGPGANPSLPPVVPGPGVPPSTEPAPPPSTDPGPPTSATPTAPSTSVVVPVPTTPVVTTPPRPTPTTGGPPDDGAKSKGSAGRDA